MRKLVPIGILALTLSAAGHGPDDPWQRDFQVDKSKLVATGGSAYFPLEEDHRLVLSDGDERLVITVLPQTRKIDGVVCRVIEERETKAGALVEISRNFVAADPETGDVYYFGEEVDMYRAGKIVSHEGAWQSGRNGAKFGLLAPGKPKIGQAYYQEVAPKIAMDRAKVVGFVTLKTPAGTFERCLKTEETTPLEPQAREFKVYAPGIGLVQDADLKLAHKP